jgi:hypothetical protein
MLREPPPQIGRDADIAFARNANTLEQIDIMHESPSAEAPGDNIHTAKPWRSSMGGDGFEPPALSV